jgi:hypothetical protein
LPVSVSLPAPATSVSAAAVPVSVSALVPSWSTALGAKAPLVLPKMT